MIKQVKNFGWVVFLYLLMSCADHSKDEYGNLPKALIDSLETVGPKVQHLQVDPAKDTVVKGNQGTRLYIAAGSLVDEKGKTITAPVTITLKEYYSLTDFVFGNLQTVHDDDILQTQGMIYLTATTSDGLSVSIDKAKPIRIEFPVSERIEGTKIFTGNRDENGNLNWGEINEPSHYLVKYPIRLISGCSGGAPLPLFGEAGYDCYGITLDPINYSDYTYIGDIDKFENTFLATREFRERFIHEPGKDMITLYIKNLDKNLWEADELFVKHLIEDSTQRASKEWSFKYDSIHEKDMIEWQVELRKEAHDRIEGFKRFARQKLTNIDPAKRKVDTSYMEVNRAYTSFDALHFGWVNVDHFYNDPKAENVKLVATTNAPVQTVYLILPDRNIILSGIGKDGNTFWFTKKEDGYNKLPKGEKAILAAIGLVNNEVHFAFKEIVIGKNEVEPLVLKKSTAREIATRLKAVSK